MGMIRGPPGTPRSLCQHRQYASRCAERRFMRTDLWEPKSIPTGSSRSRCSLTRIELTRVFIKWYHEWGKERKKRKKGIEVYLLWSIIVLSIEIFRYGIDGVFFGSWKSVRRKDWAFGFSNMFWMFDSLEGRSVKESFSILFKGGKMDETRWGE